MLFGKLQREHVYLQVTGSVVIFDVGTAPPAPDGAGSSHSGYEQSSGRKLPDGCTSLELVAEYLMVQEQFRGPEPLAASESSASETEESGTDADVILSAPVLTRLLDLVTNSPHLQRQSLRAGPAMLNPFNSKARVYTGRGITLAQSV